MKLHPTRLAGIALAAVLAAPACPVGAQVRPPAPAGPSQEPPAADGGKEKPRVAPDSPRASLERFFDATRHGRWAEAGRHLQVPAGTESDPAGLARRLRAVLDRHAIIAWDDVSPLSSGNPDDGLPPGVDEIAQVPGASGTPEPVRLTRKKEPGDPAWVFSAGTISHVDAWYESLENRWILENVPEPLLRRGPGGLAWWQWIALAPLFTVAYLVGILLTWLTVRALRSGAARTSAAWDDRMVERIGGPLRVAWTLVIARPLLALLALGAAATELMISVLETGFFIALFWALLRATTVVGEVVTHSPWAVQHPSARSLVPLGVRTAKVTVIVIGSISVISSLGYPVASIIAGLGIGGLAVALAAQKTVENLFGSVSLGVDQPIRVGDFVRVEDFVATVESIGLRSTRFRTLDRTLVTLPNGRLAEMRLESLTARDRMRLATVVGLSYSTTAAQMKAVLEGLEGVLRAHPKIWPDAVVVRFKELGASSLDIEIMAWFQVPEWSDFQVCRQEVLIGFMEVVEQAGTSIAFPTRTVHLHVEEGRLPGPDGPGPRLTG